MGNKKKPKTKNQPNKKPQNQTKKTKHQNQYPKTNNLATDKEKKAQVLTRLTA